MDRTAIRQGAKSVTCLAKREKNSLVQKRARMQREEFI